ncbi:uncharacterized protein LOC129971510 isoform X2 [Argiope bruennichi]|nr:uncharacterized protein LOC129971510 isoform X2 [Argiope bruennichi]XP_055941318.1 uncharacterized protein LOC129971510 isoform X2 [Argiope bruennichi]
MREPPKKLPSNDKTHIYRCDSSVGSMREKKSGVAVKDSCPAVITAIESTKTKGVKIEHWNTHVGHIIPIEEDELDAAIGSLGTTEIVLTSDQKYQFEGQSPDGNIFFITESNDSSLSETFVKEVSKKSSNLFQNTNNKIPDNFSKPASQKFSYKKDPTKKSGSFSYSLASVACMKPSAKKKIVTPPPITTTSSVADNVSTAITNSDVLSPAPASSVATSEVELVTESIDDAITDISSNNDISIISSNTDTPVISSNTDTPVISSNTDTPVVSSNIDTPVVSSNTDAPVISKEEETPATPATTSENVSIANTTPITNQTFEFINDGSLSGQVVLLNSLPGQNNNQNVMVGSDQKFISIGPAINVGTVSPKKGKTSKKSRNTVAPSQIIVIPTATEKENVSSVKNILDVPQNPVCHDNVIKSPTASNKSSGPSILKRTKKAVQKPPKKSASSSVKNITFGTKNAIEKTISAEQKLSLGLNPSLDVTIIEAVEPAQSTVNTFPGNVKIANSSAPTANSTSMKLVSNIQNTSITNSTLTVSKPVSSIAQNSVPSSISNIPQVNPILLNSFPPGQTFMSINNNLIPIGTPAAPLLPSNFSPGIVLTPPVPPSPITRPVRPRMTVPRPPAKNKMTYSRLASRLPVSSSTPIESSDKKSQSKQTNTGPATCIKIPPHTSTVPLLLIPNSGSQIGPSVPFSSPFVASSVNSTLSSTVRPNKTQPIISSPLIPGGVCSVLPRPLISNSNLPIFTHLPPGAQLIPTPIISGIPASFLNNNGPQTSKPLLQNLPILTSTAQQVPKSILQNVSLAAPLIGQPPVASKTIVSTTVSNTIKVQKVQLPFSKIITTNSNATLKNITSVSTNLSESTNVSSVVLNTQPISSAPAINIPPLASIAGRKPGSVIFESQGDMYMLEPVEDNLQISNNNSVSNITNKISTAVLNVSENKEAKKSNEMRESASDGNKANLSSLQKEKFLEGQSILDTKVDGYVKSLPVRKNSDIKNSVQIKSIVQEKRHSKDDDVEILKKVKYYQLEMKFLSSQAECKRLRLELAKAQKKNKEIVKSDTDLLFGEKSMKGNADEDVVDIDITSSNNNLQLNQTFIDGNVAENMAMDIDNASHEKNDKTTADLSVGIQALNSTKLSNQSDADSGDSNPGSDICAESEDSNCDGNSLVDSGNSNLSSIVDLSSKENQAKDSLGNQNNNHDLKIMNSDVELRVESDLKPQKETHNALNKEFQNINTQKNESNNLNSCKQTYKTGSKEKLKDSNKSVLINVDETSGNHFQKLTDELMDISETEDNVKNVSEENQTVKNSEIADQFVVEESNDKHMHVSNKEISVQNNNLDSKEHLIEHNELSKQKAVNEEDFMDFIEQNNSNLEIGNINPPCDNTQFQETLKDLEIQYGKKESSDIYTMIRTSVLRSLYDDMKTLCEENKKLYEKLQKCRSAEESCETDKLHS